MGSRPDSMPIGVSRLSPKQPKRGRTDRRETLAPRAIWREVGVEGRGRCRRSIQIPQLSAGIEHDRSKSITPLAQAHPRRIFGRALSNHDRRSQQCDWSASAGPQGARLRFTFGKKCLQAEGIDPRYPLTSVRPAIAGGAKWFGGSAISNKRATQTAPSRRRGA